jgi:hypothetical protein
VTVDGTDLQIYEPTPFSKKWYSHKFRAAGLRYEVAVCIQTGDIVWFHGPFPCGEWPDLKIFRDGLKKVLAPGEKSRLTMATEVNEERFELPMTMFLKSTRKPSSALEPGTRQ